MCDSRFNPVLRAMDLAFIDPTFIDASLLA